MTTVQVGRGERLREVQHALRPCTDGDCSRGKVHIEGFQRLQVQLGGASRQTQH